MAKFGSTKKAPKKKKGPKGKKARAKAKLERQWGEHQNSEMTTVRRGKSRLLQEAPEEEGEYEDAVVKERMEEEVHDDGDDSSIDGKDAFQSFLQSCEPLKEVYHQEEVTEEESEDEDVMETTIDDEVPDYTLPFHPFRSRFDAEESTKVADVTRQPVQSLSLDSNKWDVFQSCPRLFNDTPWPSLSAGCLKALHDNLQNEWKEQSLPKNKRIHNLVFPFLSTYSDVLLCSPDAFKAEQSTALHILQHVMTTRLRIQSNNKKKEPVRDQGFTRPTVLVLLPTRGMCHKFVKEHLLPLLGSDVLVEKMDRFGQEFGPPEVEVNSDAKAELRRQKVLAKKGKEWLGLFGDGVNDDDDFRMGMSLNMKKTTTVKLFTDFFRSDIILASPLGLKMTLSEAEDKADILSSIEICLLTRTDTMMMQNLEHMDTILSSLNQQPKESKETDFSRVRPYFLDGKSAEWRQLIMLCPFTDPFLLSTFKRTATSRDGQVRLLRRTTNDDAALGRIVLPTRQVFQRVDASSFLTQSEDKLKYFAQSVLPQLEKQEQKHTLLYIPSYFDFVAVRNLLLKRELDFVSVHEYSRESEVSRGRARFLQGRKPWMLFTGRAYYFLRHIIKGARHVVFYGIPEHAAFYADHVNRLDGDNEQQDNSCFVLFTKYEAHALERVVGRQNANRMIQGEKTTFLFN